MTPPPVPHPSMTAAGLSISTSQHEAIQALINDKYQYLDTVTNVSMLWWVYTIVFVSGVVFGLIQVRDHIERLSRRKRHALFYLVGGAFLTSAIYPLIAALCVYWLMRDIQNLTATLQVSKSPSLVREFWVTIAALINGFIGFSSLIGVWLIIREMFLPPIRKKVPEEEVDTSDNSATPQIP